MRLPSLLTAVILLFGYSVETGADHHTGHSQEGAANAARAASERTWQGRIAEYICGCRKTLPAIDTDQNPTCRRKQAGCRGKQSRRYARLTAAGRVADVEGQTTILHRAARSGAGQPI